MPPPSSPLAWARRPVLGPKIGLATERPDDCPMLNPQPHSGWESARGDLSNAVFTILIRRYIDSAFWGACFVGNTP